METMEPVPRATRSAKRQVINQSVQAKQFDDDSKIEERPTKKSRTTRNKKSTEISDDVEPVSKRKGRQAKKQISYSIEVSEDVEPVTKKKGRQAKKQVSHSPDDRDQLTEQERADKSRASKKANDESKIAERPKKKTRTTKSTEFKENQDRAINATANSSASSSNNTGNSTLINPVNAEDENSTESSENGFNITIMRKIFYAAQFPQKQNKCVQSMFKLIKEVKFEEFYEEFCRNVKCSLQYDFENPKVKSILDMIVIFTVSIKNANFLKERLNEDTFDEIGLECFGKDTFLIDTINKTYKNLLDYILSDALIPFLKSINVSTRLNTLYLVREILKKCTHIEEQIYERLKRILIDRLQDKNVNVRLSASRALHRFQTADDRNDNVIDAIRFHLKYDISPSVRLECLKSITPADHVLPDLILKTRDISSKIRDIAFQKIAMKVDLKRFTVDQRLTLLNNGFKDRSEAVQTTVRKILVPAWIKAYDDDIIYLLNDLETNENVEVISKFLEIVFQYSFSITIENNRRTRLHLIIDKFSEEYLDEKSILTKKQLSPENSLFWRCLGAFLKKNEDEVMKYQPDLENRMNLRKEINSLLEAIDDLEVQDETLKQINSTKLPNESNLSGKHFEHQQSRVDPSTSQLLPEEQSIIEKELQAQEDSMSKVNPIDLIIPSLSNFVAFFKNFCSEINNGEFEQDDLINFEFIFKELCLYLDNYEIVDESQKQLIVNMSEEIIMMEELSDKFDDYIENLMKFLSKSVFKSNDELINYTVYLTNKVQDSLEHKNQVEDLPIIDPKEIRNLELNFARESLHFNELKDKLDEALVLKQYDCAHGYKQQIEVIEEKMANIKHEINKMQNISIRQQAEPEIDIDIKDYPTVHLKLLQIFGSFLRYGTFTNLTAMMDTRIQNYVIPGILSTDQKIRYYALKALNHACFLSSTLSTRFCALYHEICVKDCEHLQIIALKGLIDALIEHGLYILYPNDEPDQTENAEQSILNTPAPYECDEQSEERKKSNVNSVFSNTREFTKASSFLHNRSEITTPNISMMDEEDELNNLHYNTNNESDLDQEEEEEGDGLEFDENQANLTMKSQIIDQNKTVNKTQLQIEKEEEIIKQLTKFLLKFIRSGNEEIKSTSVLSICKLLLLGKIYSPLLLSEIILLWYNSSTSLSIQHDIGTFLPIYCQASTLYGIDIPENFNGQHCLLECFMSTVENVYRLERGEQLEISIDLMRSNYYDSDIDVHNVIEFMLNLLEPRNHFKIALEFCEKILSALQIVRDDEYELKEPYITNYLIRSLNSFNLVQLDDEEQDTLNTVVQSIHAEKRFKELKKLSSSRIEKFAVKVHKMIGIRSGDQETLT